MNYLNEFIDWHEGETYDEMRKTEIKVPKDFNFSYDIVDRYAKEAPEKRAMVWCNDKGEEHVFTFKQISEDSQRTANFLVSHGIQKGDVVMIIMRRRYEFWWLILALHRIGAICVPATNQLLTDDIVYRCNSAEVKMIVCLEDEKLESHITEALPQSPSVKSIVTLSSGKEGWVDFHKELPSFSACFPRPEGEKATHNDDPMLMYFTSGTSGYPKMVMHNYTYPLAHIVTAKFWQCVEDDGLHLSVAETGWGKAVWGKLYGQWISGSAVFVYDLLAFTPDLFFKKMAHYKVNTFCAPPTAYRFLIRQDMSNYDLSNLHYCVTAGEALNSEVFNKFYEKTGIKMFEAYGQTETTLVAGNFPGMEPKPGSMGKPAPGYDVDIVRPDGKKCTPLETGSLVIRIDQKKPLGLFSGYYKNEEQTKKALSGVTYNTGDQAYFDDDGYIWFVGRNDDIIKSTGFRISPFEVESVLQQHPSVLECAVTGMPDPRRGQIVKASIILNKGFTAGKDLEKEIKGFVAEHLALYKIPRVIEFVEALPKTISGKIRRVEIREHDKEKQGE